MFLTKNFCTQSLPNFLSLFLMMKSYSQLYFSFSAPANFSLLEETETLAIASGNTSGLSVQIGKKDNSLFTVYSVLVRSQSSQPADQLNSLK